MHHLIANDEKQAKFLRALIERLREKYDGVTYPHVVRGKPRIVVETIDGVDVAREVVDESVTLRHVLPIRLADGRYAFPVSRDLARLMRDNWDDYSKLLTKTQRDAVKAIWDARGKLADEVLETCAECKAIEAEREA